MADNIETKSDKLVQDFKDGLPSQQFKPLINDIQNLDPKESAAVLKRANEKLDQQFPSQFGDVDIVGAHDGKLVLKKVSTGETAEIPGDRQAAAATPNSGDKPHVKTKADGSTVEYLKQADGKEHPTKVVHPDGQTTVYTYDQSGKPNSVSEFKPDGTLDKKYTCNDGKTWTKAQGGAMDPPTLIGSLNVGDDGSHNFTDQFGTTVTRRSDGSITMKNAYGATVADLPPSARRADAPTQNTDSAAQPAPDTSRQNTGGGGGGPSGGETFKPKDSYSPVGPPGLGEFDKGDHFFWERSGNNGLYDIDNRSVTGTETNPTDKSTTYRYKGEVDDGILSDTNFEASERYSQDGKLLERHIKYDGSVDMPFKTPDGKKDLKGVTEVDSSFDAQSGNYISTIVTKDGTRYRAVTAPDGTVKSFDQTTGQTQETADGMKDAQVGNFGAKSDGVYNPVRPTGLSEMVPGQATDSDNIKGIDWRHSQKEQNADGSSTYRYDGELKDWGFLSWGDTNFHAEETVDKSGALVRTDIKYDSAKDLQFAGPGGKPVKIDDVTESESHRTADGGFETTVTTKDHKIHKFYTAADGTVKDYKKPD